MRPFVRVAEVDATLPDSRVSAKPSILDAWLATLTMRAPPLKHVGPVRAIVPAAIGLLAHHPIGEGTVVGTSQSTMSFASLIVPVDVANLGSRSRTALKHQDTSLFDPSCPTMSSPMVVLTVAHGYRLCRVFLTMTNSRLRASSATAFQFTALYFRSSPCRRPGFTQQTN